MMEAVSLRRENKGSAVMGGWRVPGASCNSHLVTIMLVILHSSDQCRDNTFKPELEIVEFFID